MPDWGNVAPDSRKGRAKYNNRKAYYQGIGFDSELERDRFIFLASAQERGEITGLRRQVWYEVVPRQIALVKRRRNGAVIEKMGVVESSVNYIADFVYVKDGREVVEDTKGCKTAAYVIKRKLMRLQGHPVREVKKATESV